MARNKNPYAKDIQTLCKEDMVIVSERMKDILIGLSSYGDTVFSFIDTVSKRRMSYIWASDTVYRNIKEHKDEIEKYDLTEDEATYQTMERSIKLKMLQKLYDDEKFITNQFKAGRITESSFNQEKGRIESSTNHIKSMGSSLDIYTFFKTNYFFKGSFQIKLLWKSKRDSIYKQSNHVFEKMDKNRIINDRSERLLGLIIDYPSGYYYVFPIYYLNKKNG